jgi:pyruvate/2-oxoglutarate dehydrogenase complex dihydrolipoamide dehydrogenase (E3) component
VLGGGAAAVSLAQAMRRLGSEVALAAPDGLLPDEDPEAAALVRRALLRDGIALHEGVAVLRAETHRHHPRLVLAGESVLEGTHLLVAAGRLPDIGGLELDLAGIRGDAGGIVVDRGLRTSNRRVYAVGACAGGAATGLDSLHAARHQAALVVRNALFRLPARLDRHAVPRVVQSDPPVASVGRSEREARERGAVQVLRWPYAEVELTSAERSGEGLVKLVADRKGRILGVTIAGAQAAELIAPWCLAIRQRLGVTEMAGFVVPSPSYSEISQRVALSSYAPLAVKPGIRRLIGFLRRFG